MEDDDDEEDKDDGDNIFEWMKEDMWSR